MPRAKKIKQKNKILSPWEVYRIRVILKIFQAFNYERKWISFFHVIGQTRLDCELAEIAIENCEIFERTERRGDLWLRIAKNKNNPAQAKKLIDEIYSVDGCYRFYTDE